ncbi:PepSY domain-containing protein [Capnocytophaga catalasegens]|uniref:Sulfite reductase (NADPH) flavoprotein alpha-component n=1 Tax=Capnocytophaga catalasegens TaxID=1004260 RepID=A0AAV5ATQ9_9FLAO|nr:PepSY domain-containing protein [Capnocytophaga catalasegens]GIZ14479.1 hypothetical protein RCZ03_04800 [Capnocytophaga catalasegens]GJM50681.1 hypothetical protein RCZ15_16540 [Capnocytophaga catalasegens]GJM51834.1 hypothetical protein RCZ16_01520 [Capnocytophaga catalasegens]
MTLSLWRYTHLGLAIVCSIFLFITSVTGGILAVHSIDEQVPSYRSENFSNITLSQLVPVLRERYVDITALTIDHRGFASIEATDDNGDDIKGYIDVKTGEIIGKIEKKSTFIQWVTSLHRSLFLHELGRIFVGIISFLLFLIAFSGFILVIRRQEKFWYFFSKIVKENFAQYYHIILGKWMLIPILIIALTGTYLSVNRFLISEKKIIHSIDFEQVSLMENSIEVENFEIFKTTFLSDVKSVEFPFSKDKEDYFLVKLTNKEIVIHQYSGDILSEIFYPTTSVLATLSLDLHTGRTQVFWAVILLIACVSILFFIFSGFTITFSRKTLSIQNPFNPHTAEIIILFGSEGGSTLHFANQVHQQFLKLGKKSFLEELNNYKKYPKSHTLLIFTSTYGIGEAPSNARKFVRLLEKNPQNHDINYAIVGFGSTSYPSFCQFAYKIESELEKKRWAKPLLNIHTIDNKSATQWIEWTKKWNETTHVLLSEENSFYLPKSKQKYKMKVVEKTFLTERESVFSVQLKTKKKFTSGDLLAIYVGEQERLYSIGKINKNIHLIVKLYSHGIGSNFLYNLKKGDRIEARIIKNSYFHLPKKEKEILFVANGTGIAPFLGMIEQNEKKKCYLYAGFRYYTPIIGKYETFFQAQKTKNKLENYQFAFSKENNYCYVNQLLEKDAIFVAQFLQRGGVIMICGSLAMYKDVEAILDRICMQYTDNQWEYYKQNGQFLVDCY